jgi:RNA-binding protein 39
MYGLPCVQHVVVNSVIILAGTGLQIPQAAATALNLNPAGNLPIQQPTPPIATQCFMLANMFDPAT